MSSPRVIKSLKGAGKVYDFRGTGVCPGYRSGGRYVRIKPLIMVEHIPVMHNKTGIQDFYDLGAVLRAQGLHLQAATDREGNVALYNDLNVLCYQARGANQVSCGVEHMHMSVGEEWLKKQLRASAWLRQYAEREYGIPLQNAILGSGSGTVKVIRKGHCSHRRVSSAAGYNDRSDPGAGYDFEYVKHCAQFFKRHGHFEGA